MKLRHPYCQNPDCGICMEDHTRLGDRLEEDTCNDKVDHLGRYRSYLDTYYPNHSWETEWGWASPETFKEEYIEEYVSWFVEADDGTPS